MPRLQRLTVVGGVAALLVVSALIAKAQQGQTAGPSGQATPAAAAPQESVPQASVPTLRIGVTGVEIDAVVTDKGGKHVPDLQANDFEVLQDGKPQPITSFRYFPVRPRPAAAAAQAPASHVGSGSPAPTLAVPLTTGAQLKRGQTGRTMAIVIDDLALRFQDMSHIRDAIDKFIDREVRDDDAVSIVTTSHGVGRLQQFTNDKSVLKETAAQLQINLLRGSLDEDEPSADSAIFAERFQAGALAAVENVVRGMREIPGRKAVVFVSNGFALLEREGRGQFYSTRPYVAEALKRLVDESNRSFVVIHTIDARGVYSPAVGLYNAEHRTAPTAEQIRAANIAYDNSRQGPDLLARDSGGLSLSSNDFSGAFAKALADQEGYYLLGYQPETSTFQKGRDRRPVFRTIQVRLKRADLRVRARSGFFGMTDDEANRPPQTVEQQLWAAAASPFVADELGVRVTPIFGHRKAGDLLRVLLHIDGQGLTFTKGGDGEYHAPIELLTALVDGRGAPVESKIYRMSVHSRREPDVATSAAGFTYAIDLPAKLPGAYQLRVAVRDTGSNRTGTGYQFVQVPDLNSSRLALSGIVLAGGGAETQTGSAPDAGAEVRHFLPSSTLLYVFDAYNAQRDPASHQPALTVRHRLYHGGSLVVEDKPAAVETRPAAEDPERGAEVTGALQLSPAIKPGEYQLQIEVTDTQSHSKKSTAHQWIDFTVGGPS